ncbi:DNA replication/repair protein RecF [Lunatibacter salilacus]|uniref:DNA replication/repair protein RecF n=1 Tax=Lunatibacter salilacus TaxID=2483804 RepID=UPI00131DC794|nr:DNA replication/repair protein RecF [Lunatibacter salilacus]
MHLKNISLRQFKNFSADRFEFSEEVNCFLGLNGAGKTNLLDAIHYLCLTKSAFQSVDQFQMLHGTNFFMVKGSFINEGKILELDCSMESGKKKQLVLNGKPYQKMSDHIGLFPVVLIAPDDTSLIRDGSEERRRFFDNMLSQLSSNYLNQLVRYQHFLKQRNALLKQFHDSGKKDLSLLEPYSRELIQLSDIIHRQRFEFIQNFAPGIQSHYSFIAGESEKTDITYTSDAGEKTFEKDFRNSLEKDLILKRTNKGIHKDDYIFTIGGHSLKKFGSQGQQKSYLISLKLSQFDAFKLEKKQKPILLLDDIFDKLDDIRIGQLMKLVAKRDFGQLFITDARPERSIKIFSDLQIPAKLFHIEEGKLTEVTSI